MKENADAAPGWLLVRQPPAEYLHWAAARRALFFLPEWMAVVSHLGARPWYAWHAGRGSGLAVPAFHRGPLRAAYLGFPVLPTGGERPQALLDELGAALHRAGAADLLRIAHTLPAGAAVPAGGIVLPEALIAQLHDWPGAQGRRLARDLKYARNAARGHVLGDGAGQGQALHALYTATVRRHGGNARYTRGYFIALAELAARRPDLLAVRTLQTADGAVRAFAVAGLHEDLGCYLHAGVDGQARINGAADLLLDELVGWARGAGAQRFTLMASPPAQAGLVRFKAKWSDTACMNITEERGLGWKGRLLAAALRWRRSAAKPAGTGEPS